MQQTMIPNSGIMTVPQIAAPQLVYLDFDGELASYNGELLTIDRVEVEDSGLTEPQIARIVSGLNEEFEGQNIVFTAEKPASGEYSTVFIGGTSAFEPFGSFAGLAETVDTGNAVRNDNAFVILKGGESIEAIIDTIAHETQHLIGTLDHGGEGLGRYAWVETLSLSNVSSSGLKIGQDSGNDAGYVSASSATLVSTTVNSGGCLSAFRGQLTSTVVNSSGVVYLSRGSATAATINGGRFHLRQATLVSATVSNDGVLTLFTGSVSSATVNSASIIVSGGSANGMTLNNASMYIHSGGVVSGLALTSGGYASIQYSGLISSGTVFSSSYILNSGGELKAIRLSGGRIHCAYGGQATGITGVNGSLSMDSGGKILSAAIGGSADFEIRNNGIASSMTSYLSARMAVRGGGSAVNTTLNSATVFVRSGGCVRNLSMSRGIMYLSGSAILSGSIVNGGKLVTGGLVNAFGATYTVNLAGYTGTEVTDALVDNYANLASVSYAVRVASDQQTGVYRLLGNAADFNQLITLDVAGISASPGTLSVGGSLETWSHRYALTRTGSTVALQVTMNDLPVKIYSDGVMVSGGKTISSKTISGSGVVMRISGGGVATATTVSSDGTIFISSGGGASGITARGSGTNVENRGGVMTDFSQYDGFSLIAEGGSVRNLNASGGQVAFLDATLGGMIHAAVYGAIDVSSQTTIDFSVADHTADGTALITRWNNIANGTKANYTITVKADQSAGTYILATGAGTFNQTLTVKNDTGSEFGTIALDETKRFGNSSYTLGKDGIKLTLTVEKATATRGDFDGNGISDILFQNLADSANPLGAWMNADKTQWNGALGPAPKSDWTVYGAYDFTGSGVCDIMFRSKRADTQYAVGYYEDGDVTQFRTMGWGVTAEWELADVGDFNGSGRADILWKNSSNGYLGLWMDGTDQWVALPASNLGSGQSLIGMGDVNGDGKDDILINSNGVLGYWDITGILDDTSSTPEWNAFGIHVGNEWETIGCADFDGNGKADIVLWRDRDGYVGTYMNCDVNDFRGIYPGASKDEWGLPGFGDYNGDGCDDVLVRNLASGALGYWDGADEFKWNEIGSGVDSTWAVIA
ncbi:VCBS repeat-containing protein [Victivallaceae bacterium BBE-744-WT-12]|uniref:VCBS repeat-containing protein n=1 Tax=Victivallis lenta TaxID=2606640 RepID=A0A844G8F6_9BACT|nr:FG-GAP-like repeat-containing protein [Victivallis lenta]MST99463.1 VCBS repeat-containing protein [Victivallis lenta]